MSEIIHKVPEHWSFLLRDMFIQLKQAEYHYNVMQGTLTKKLRDCALLQGALPDSNIDFDVHAGTILETRKDGLKIGSTKEGE